MRCNICDKSMTDKEIQITPDGKTYEPCSTCMEIALDAAYSDGFLGDESTEKTGSVETLEREVFSTDVYAGDWGAEYEEGEYDGV